MKAEILSIENAEKIKKYDEFLKNRKKIIKYAQKCWNKHISYFDLEPDEFFELLEIIGIKEEEIMEGK